MSKNISVTDLKLIPELSGLRMLDFIDPKNDSLIAPFLKILGFDLDYPIQFIPSQHRNMQGKVVIAYMISGEVECNSSFLTSEWASVEDKMIAAGYKDLGLAEDMANSLTTGRDYGSDSMEGFPPELANPDENGILQQIEVLENLLLLARGSPFKQDGSRATLSEYGMVETPEKQRRKPVKLPAGGCDCATTEAIGKPVPAGPGYSNNLHNG